MQAAQMLVADGKVAGGSDLLVDFEAGLFGVGVLHVGVHGAEA